MRFIENGPSIPDELLLARDQGRVVFFCGSGVSRAKVNLPDFFGLLTKVIHKLGVLTDAPVQKILDEAQKIERITGVPGLISADRLFGLLERDFFVQDIEREVATCLKPTKTPDLTAHNILLDLATTTEGHIRLVTTNFDRLFDSCKSDLKTWQPPHLPDPSSPTELNGVVYLHGKVNSEYSGAEGNGLILSSSDFGRAYLAEGWATDFIRAILINYHVVFIGYSADDPPVQYLLEALRKNSGKLENVYAFQSGTESEANSKWHHKGVNAIAYESSDDHVKLWNTLSAWASRARNINQWYLDIIDKAKSGPEKMPPHERGQVAHIVSTTEGMKKFADGDNPPPAEWLCVFDPERRYAKPGRSGDLIEEGVFVDPFNLYSIDADSIPQQIEPDDFYSRREIPKDSWCAFSLNEMDKKDLSEANVSGIHGYKSTNTPALPTRLALMAFWIGKVAHQTAAIWWAVRQQYLHPEIQNQIHWRLSQALQPIKPEIQNAWSYLLSYWEQGKQYSSRDWYQLDIEIKRDGWNHITARKYASYFRPYLKIEHGFSTSVIPPNSNENISTSSIMNLDVKYSEYHEKININNNWLPFIIKELRKNLEIAYDLEIEIGGIGLYTICPVTPEKSKHIDHYSRNHGLSGHILRFASLFEDLTKINPTLAKNEFFKWNTEDNHVFSILRIWAARNPKIITNKQFGKFINSLNNDVFWNSRHQRDLLLTLSSRWNNLDKSTQIRIEKRILKGPAPWEQEDEKHFLDRKSWDILNTINWLAKDGCTLNFDLESKNKELQVTAPDWKPEYANSADQSLEGKFGTVKTNTDYAMLLTEPLESILSIAEEINKRKESFTRHNPFGGLAKEKPIRAFSTLRLAAKKQNFPEWAWKAFLNVDSRKNDSPKFTNLISKTITSIPDEILSKWMHFLTNWLLQSSEKLLSYSFTTGNSIILKLIRVLSRYPESGTPGIISNNNKNDWNMEAIKSPSGKIAQSIFNYPSIQNLEINGGFPSQWLDIATSLIHLSSNAGRYSLVIFARNLDWLYSIDVNWTENNLLYLLDQQDSDDIDALLSGFFRNRRVPMSSLYIRLKPYLIQLSKNKDIGKRPYAKLLSGIILAGWGSTTSETDTKHISDNELRDILVNTDDEFRSGILWHAEEWLSEDGDKWLSLLKALFQSVWPKQISARSPSTSTHLCDLLFSNTKAFAELFDLVTPFIDKVQNTYFIDSNLRKDGNNITQSHPEKILSILCKTLPTDISKWPYNIENIFSNIITADKNLESDTRYIELTRRWNSR